MRRMNERHSANHTEQVDGLKVDFGHEWVLVRPDPDEPLCHIYAESSTHEESVALCDKFVAIVVELQS